MTLTARIIALILVVQLALGAMLGAVLVVGARASVAAETADSVRAARALVLSTLATLTPAIPGDDLMPALAERLVEPRHARILVRDNRGTHPLPPARAVPLSHAPAWFVRLLTPALQEIRVPVIQNQHMRGMVAIIPDPAAEIADTWHDARALAALLIAAAAVQMLMILAVLRHGLRPLDRLGAVVGRLTLGDLDARAGQVASPDLKPLAAGLDRLAGALAQAQADRARLSRQIVTRGDQERKAIARDLHDEYGPNLFALRVEAAAIRDAAADPAMRDRADNILAIADDIRRVNTALLSGLRPMALGQLPLTVVLGEMFDDLAARHDGIDWSLDVAPGLVEPDDATALTIYRILQEGATNALRHAGATRIAAGLQGGGGAGGWQVWLTDDGRGMSGAPEGNGLSGMRERVALLGGTMSVQDGPEGVTLTARLPAVPAISRTAGDAPKDDL